VKPSRPVSFALKLRIPYWSERTRVRLNGQAVRGVEGGSYLVLAREWTGREKVELDLDLSLHYWVGQMHVDGFRFDLASILARDESGHVLPNPPILWDIESDPLLAGTKLIAEAWDAAGLYQVGSFIGDSWKEWNGRFRDDVRDFFRGQEGTVGRLADRLLGSPDTTGTNSGRPSRASTS
jgi:hypothetical protein